MIDFKTHIELFNEANRENYSSPYLEKLNALERLDLTRDIQEVYPIKNTSRVTKYISDNFNVTKTVEEAVLGQFIMLEQIVTGKTRFKNEYDRDLAFAKLILRPKHHEVFDNENPEDEKLNEEMILSSPVQDVYSAINCYIDNREFVLFKQFAGVFYEVSDDDDDEEDEEESKTANALFNQQWYWYSIVRKLANEDITKYDKIYMLKMATVLPEMSYLTQKDKIESANQRMQQAANKL